MNCRGGIGGLLLLALFAPGRLLAAPDAPSFADSIQPLLVAKCGRCHGQESQKAELSLHAASGIQKGGESGPVIVPGKPDESPLFEKIHAGEMPPDQENPLTEPRSRRFAAGSKRAPPSARVQRKQVSVTYHDDSANRAVALHVVSRPATTRRRTRSAHRASMLRGGKSGPAIVPGKPDDSLLVKRVLRRRDAAARSTGRGHGQADGAGRVGEACAMDRTRCAGRNRGTGYRLHRARSAGQRRGSGLLVIQASADHRTAGRHAHGFRSQSDRCFRAGETRSQGPSRCRPRRTGARLLRSRYVRFNRITARTGRGRSLCADPSPDAYERSDRSATGVTALRRALGAALAGRGRLRRLRRAPRATSDRATLPGAIAITSFARSTPTNRTIAFWSSSSPGTIWSITENVRANARRWKIASSPRRFCAWPPIPPGPI